VEDLITLADDGLIGSIDVLCSHYFSASDAAIYQQMVEQFRRHGFRVVAMRTHAKILLMRQGATWYAIESSANLRSSHNVETATVINSPEVFRFHREWILDLINRGEAGTPASKGDA
jgi:hypothetical protein